MFAAFIIFAINSIIDKCPSDVLGATAPGNAIVYKMHLAVDIAVSVRVEYRDWIPNRGVGSGVGVGENDGQGGLL